MANFLGLRQSERTAFFIDGANFYKASRGLGFDIDYKSLLAKAKEHCQLVRASYYTTIQEDRDQDFSPLRPLIDWLDYNGYTMVTKATREYTDQNGRKRFKGSTDIELVTDLMLMAGRLDHAIVFTGNGDFLRAIEAVQSMGVRVSIVATVKSSPPMASDELRRQADSFLDLADLEGQIGRSGGAPRRAKPEDDYDDEDEFEDDFEDID